MKDRNGRTRHSSPTQDALLREYTEVAASWRFFTGIRFALLTFATTLLSIVVTAYEFAMINKEQLGLIGRIAPFVLPAIGGFCTFLLILFEERARILYGTCLRRGKKLEEILSLHDGHFQKLWTAPLPWKTSHTRTIRILYGLSLIFALVIEIYGFIGFLHGR